MPIRPPGVVPLHGMLMNATCELPHSVDFNFFFFFLSRYRWCCSAGVFSFKKASADIGLPLILAVSVTDGDYAIELPRTFFSFGPVSFCVPCSPCIVLVTGLTNGELV